MKIPITHLIVYGEIKRRGNGSKIVQISDIRPIIKWRLRIPSKYHFEVISELIEYGLLRQVGRDNYEILCCHRKAPIDSLGEPFW